MYGIKKGGDRVAKKDNLTLKSQKIQTVMLPSRRIYMYVRIRKRITTRTNTYYYCYYCKSFRIDGKVKKSEKYLCKLNLKQILDGSYLKQKEKINNDEIFTAFIKSINKLINERNEKYNELFK